MWIASKYGFFSIVEKPKEEFHIRARAKKDLEALSKAAGFISIKIHTSLDGDYRYRLVVNRAVKDLLMKALSDSIDYDNFKNVIAKTPAQKDKLDIYHRIWDLFFNYQWLKENPVKSKKGNNRFYSSVKKLLDK